MNCLFSSLMAATRDGLPYDHHKVVVFLDESEVSSDTVYAHLITTLS